MNRKIIYMILAALAVVLLVGLLWWWFLQREQKSIQTTGTFGTAQNAGTNDQTSGSNGQTNIGAALPGQDTSTQTNVDLGTAGSTNGGIDVGAPLGSSTVPVVAQVQGQVGVPGVIWLSGTPGGVTVGSISNTAGSSNAGTVFNPTGINTIAQSNPTGTGGSLPNIGFNDYGQQTGGGGGGSALGSVAVAAGVGVVTCAIVPTMQLAFQTIFGGKELATQGGAQAAVTAGQATTLAATVGTFDLGTNLRLSAGFSLLGVSVGQGNGNQTGQQIIDQFLGCMARNIAKIMLQQITNSVVNWINSGFNGSPSFVQNPTQFMQQTADVVAGNYIQSSALSFLCSPFQLQIKIAIAQSYANRNANSCTLTQVTNNINNFMNGSFSSSGGWPAFLSFVSVPTNNPYGAFMYGSIGLNAATNKAKTQVQNDLLQGSGFLSFQKVDPKTCVTQDSASSDPNTKSTPLPGPNGEQYYNVCKWVNVTPGRVIADSIGATEKSSLDQIGLAKSFDEIISALINQLMTRTLQSGLSGLSGAGGYASNFYSSDQLQSQASGQGLVTQMQADTNTAVSYASIQQGSIQDIQNAQSQLNDLFNCWSGIASSSPQAGAAVAGAAQASTTLASLEPLVAGYNNRITLANTAIVSLEQLENRALSVGSAADVTSIQNDYAAAQASGKFVTQNDVTNAQQNRSTLQSQMNSLNQQTSSSLVQCHAIH